MEHMQEFEGQREGTKKYFYDGYFYHIDPRYASSLPELKCYVCTYRYVQYQCPVTARENFTGTISVNGEHYHSRTSIEEFKRYEEYKSKLKQKARETDETPASIVEALSVQYSDVSHLMERASAKMHITRERNKHRPTSPKNLVDLGNQLEKDESTRKFYQGKVVVSQESNAIILASDAMLQRLNDSEEIYIEGTSQCVPKNKGAKQLFIIYMRRKNVGMSCVYVLCSTTTVELYGKIWKFLLERIPGFKTNLKSIMMDLERPLVISIRECMPWVTIRGCWSYYTRTIATHWEDLGLKDVPSPLARDILAMAWGLPLLPPEKFSEGIKFFRKKAEELEPEYQESVEQFIDSLENQWLQIADNVSLWGSAIQTNNLCEWFHTRILKLIGRHPTFNVFLKKLTTIITEIENDWSHPERVNKRKQSVGHSYLKSQQRLFFSGEQDIDQFLMNIRIKMVQSNIEFKLFAPNNVKNFSPEEIVKPHELINMLGDSNVPNEVPRGDEQETDELIPVYMIVNDEEEDNSNTVSVKEPLTIFEKTQAKQKPIGSIPKVSSSGAEKRKLRNCTTRIPIKISSEVATKELKKDERPRGRPSLAAPKRVETKKKTACSTSSGQEPRHTLFPLKMRIKRSKDGEFNFLNKIP